MQHHTHKTIRTAGKALAALVFLALISGAVYLGMDLLDGVGRRTTPSTSGPTGTGSAAVVTVPTTTGKPVNTGLGDNGLVQQLIEMMLNDTRFDELFADIPVFQRPDVDADTFYQYLSLLRSGIRGRITSYIPVSEQDMDAIRAEILSNAPQYDGMTDNMAGFWIQYQTAAGDEEQFAVFLHQQEDGIWYFSRDWIDGVLAIQSYATLYFDAVEKGNVDALSVLVHSEINDPDIRFSKATAIVRFYQKCVPSKASAFRLLHARVDSFAYEQDDIQYSSFLTYRPYVMETPRVTGAPTEPGGAPSVTPEPTPLPTPSPVPEIETTRTVRIVKAGMNQMKIIDPVPVNPARNDFEVYAYGEKTLALGEYVYSFELNTRFGNRLSYDAWPAQLPFDPDLSLIRAHYVDVTITLVGSVDNRLQAFQGHVYAIDLRGGLWRTGTGLSVGDPRKSVLLQHPFADLWNWSAGSPLTFDRVDYVLRDGMISDIRISRQYADLAEAIAKASRLTPTPVPDGTDAP
jgi:hypothetical protein